MATFTMYNAAESGFYMPPTDSGGWSYIEGDPNVQASLLDSGQYDSLGNYWDEYLLTGDSVNNYMLVEYWTDGFDVKIDYVLYGILYTDDTIDKTLEISNLNLQTTIDDLSGNGWFVNLNSGVDEFNGNDYADLIRGGLGNDEIFGFGGHDVLFGEAHDDIIYGGGGNDTIFGGSGTDTAGFGNSSFNYSYARNADGSVSLFDMSGGGFGSDTLYDIEFLFFDNGTFAVDSLLPARPSPLPNINGTGASETLYGDSLGDTLRGNGGNDRLYGLNGNDKLYGGTGKDTLYGGAGNDIFVFNTKLNKTTNLDKIADFIVENDSIWLDNAIFKKLGKGSEWSPKNLNKAFFTIGDKAKDANDYVVYNKDQGVLYYDADGSGNGKAVEIAILSKKQNMTYNNFFVV